MESTVVVAMIPTSVGDLYVDDQGNADAPAAVLWPSLFCDHSMWRAEISTLPAEGFRTLALDPPGHGRSPGPHRPFSMDQCAQAVLEILDAKRIRSPIVFLGTSWGGFVAPRVALRAPERVRALVLFNTSADAPTFLERLRAGLLMKLFVFGPLHAKMVNTVSTSMLSAHTKESARSRHGACQ